MAGTSGKYAALRDSYIEMISQDAFLRKIIVYMVNHRVQDFSDPLTNTLVLMATSPVQMVCCESGILPFKTSLLPVIPYALLSKEDNLLIQNIISKLPDHLLHETMESSGQYTLSAFHVLPSCKALLCKQKLLLNFVHVMFHNNNIYSDISICKTLCNIILQRFMAIVPVSSELVSTILHSFVDVSTFSSPESLLLVSRSFPSSSSDDSICCDVGAPQEEKGGEEEAVASKNAKKQRKK